MCLPPCPVSFVIVAFIRLQSSLSQTDPSAPQAGGSTDRPSSLGKLLTHTQTADHAVNQKWCCGGGNTVPSIFVKCTDRWMGGRDTESGRGGRVIVVGMTKHETEWLVEKVSNRFIADNNKTLAEYGDILLSCHTAQYVCSVPLNCNR